MVPLQMSTASDDIDLQTDHPTEEESSYTAIEDPVEEESADIPMQVSWQPGICAFLLALLSLSPYIALLFYKQGFFDTAIYLSMHLVSIPLALTIEHFSGITNSLRTNIGRWFIAFLFTIVISAHKTKTMMKYFADDPILLKCLFYAFSAFWECSNVVYIFGGKELLERDGITSYMRALLAVLCPAQVKFIEEALPVRRWLIRSSHILAYLAAFFAIRFGLSLVAGFEKYPVLEAEGIVILVACFVHVWNLPAHLYQLCMMNYPIKAVYPYGSIYFSKSSRDFWTKWSRPASSLIRHMYYYPLGGNGRAWLSIPIMFFLNASSHYSVGEVIVGEKGEMGWNVVFGVLGFAATLEVLGNRYFVVVRENGTSEMPEWWNRVLFVVAMVSLRVAAWALLHLALGSSLSNLL